MLVATAADRWQVAAGIAEPRRASSTGPSGQSVPYGELATEAAKSTCPDRVSLKDPALFQIIGQRVRRLDSRAKCTAFRSSGSISNLPGAKLR